MANVCYCADDFALNSSISNAIIDLIQKNRLHATSCMTQSPEWPNAAQQLKPYTFQAEVGLHLNFTHVFDSDTWAFSLPQLMFKAWSRQLSRQKVYESIQAQWQAFTQALGQTPDFVDGHQHVHQFPIIREVLIQFLQEQNFKGWIRNLQHAVVVAPYQFKTNMLMQLGSKSLRRLCTQSHFKQNQNFAGIYDFKPMNYASLNQKWLAQAQDDLLIMCHPAQNSTDQDDAIKVARVQEYQYLDSSQFIYDCQANQITLTRIGVSA
ncbi:ChbG/HpnK family deacetylase [Acinetobacter brisouii]|jgi:predicted glycoside hydrolase/deacetylase ChbG (UPF0249 family)|uniref:ChbG/HpnK family deacetylase n=1 Tax=Acinetobacter brisouii TaxID=396323 RepID=UPI00124F62E1|nr:ChbG/HpnK family deacetylase [Acinetobacter brisouii]